MDKVAGEIYVTSIHSSGLPATDEEVAELIRVSSQLGFVGKLQERLRLSVDAAPSESSAINIWVRTPSPPLASWQSAIEQGDRQHVFTEAALFHAQAEAPVLQFLHASGVREKYASQYVPMIACTVPNQLLLQLETLPEVLQIYDDLVASPALNTSVPTIKAQKIWQGGVTGIGVKVAIVEAFEPGTTNNAVAADNPYVGPVTYSEPMHTQSSRHATGVAGVIASNDITYRGVSFGVARPADFLSGNPSGGSASDLNAATEWAIGQNAVIINQSYRSCAPTGIIGPMGLYDDYLVALYLSTIAVCAGNIDPCSGFSALVDDPAVAYNVIAVGAFAHNNNSIWEDDSMATYSSYVDPSSTNHDRQKPEIVAPGNVNTTYELSPWRPYLQTGTSFAAPHIAGTAALLMQAKPSLKTAPEEVKAILMASAIHNIEGPSRLSDQDGAGGLQAKAAYDAVVNGWSSYFRDQTLGTCRTVSFNANSGQKIRFAITWLSLSSGNIGDLDLVLKDPSGVPVDSSTSFDNNFEIVEITAGSTGVYTAQVCPKGFGTGLRPNFGWAYFVQ